MSTPSRSRSSARGDEGYFEWSESERQMLRQCMDPWKDDSWKTNDKCKPCSKKQGDLEKKTRLNPEAVYPGTIGVVPDMRDGLRNDPYPRIMFHKMKTQTLLVSHQRDNVIKNPNCRTQCERGWDHRNLVRRGRQRSRSGRCIPTSQSHPPSRTIPHTMRLHIIHYDPPRGFLVPKFSAYDGSSDPFDHIMHYRQLMTLDIGNDALLCKVFLVSLQGQTLSWFHRLPLNSVDNFRDLSEAFVGQYLCSA
ncbi:hypothetical protein CK203_008141 [Vitis vinifera]|uniref:Retrotransposon gag domain-containing protein n=1 Tax=Vitis vinifera TaxID=29760 RepID=A0A438KNW2_VITVI|nr:hypothetical protein CK203_008141 [Vitis vinifera]